MAESKGKRVYIDDQAQQLIAQATSELKAKHCKINDSIVVAEIIQEFFRGRTERFMAAMESKYFDQRRHLQRLLKQHKDSDSLSRELAEMRARRAPRSRPAKSDD